MPPLLPALLLLTRLAVAEEPAAPPAPTPDAATPADAPAPPAADTPEAQAWTDGPGETVWVFEDGAVKKAREEIGIALRDLGYHRHSSKDGRDVYANDAPWKPWVVVDDDGWMLVKRAPVSFSKPELPGIWRGPLGYLVCVVQPTACVHVGGIVVSKRKLNAQKVEVLAQVDDEMDRYEQAVLERAMRHRTDIALPEALDRLWLEGVPLHGEGVLATPEERRAAVLEFWLTRLDDEWGDKVRVVVEDWSRNTVQTSGTPFTEAEIALARQRSHVQRSVEGLFSAP